MANPNQNALLTLRNQHTVTAEGTTIDNAAPALDSAVNGYLRSVYSAPPDTLNGGFDVSEPQWLYDGTNYVGFATVVWYTQVASI